MNAQQLAKDIRTLDLVPLDQPMNDEETAALDRVMREEEAIGAMRFWEVCAKLQIPLNQFTSN